MTQITILLNAGPNYISFPAISSENFGTMFTTSNIKQNIRSFSRYDPIISQATEVSDYEYIEDGRGYVLDMLSPGTITYDGIEYILTFNQLKSKLLRGWNLIGTGYNSLDIPNWCITIDPTTGFPVSRLESAKSYWIDYYSCIQPTTEPFLFMSIVGIGIAIISLIISLNPKKISNKQS
jgi:hypothetical protein